MFRTLIKEKAVKIIQAAIASLNTERWKSFFETKPIQKPLLLPILYNVPNFNEPCIIEQNGNKIVHDFERLDFRW